MIKDDFRSFLRMYQQPVVWEPGDHHRKGGKGTLPHTSSLPLVIRSWLVWNSVSQVQDSSSTGDYVLIFIITHKTEWGKKFQSITIFHCKWDISVKNLSILLNIYPIQGFYLLPTWSIFLANVPHGTLEVFLCYSSNYINTTICLY